MFTESNEDERKELKFDFVVSELLWRITGNPLHVWDAIAMAYQLDIEYPPSLKDYLGLAALRIRKAYVAYCSKEDIGKQATLISEVLGFTNLARKQGRGSCFEERRDLEKDLHTREMYQEVLMVEKKPDLAYKKVGDKLGVSKAAVRRACLRAEKIMKLFNKMTNSIGKAGQAL
jgi:hypothetical protein